MNTNRIRWMLIIGLVIILSACTDSNPTPAPNSTPAQSEVQQEEVKEESKAESVSKNAINLFANNCASCHGSDRSGARGPSLLPARLTKEAFHYADTITNGSGPMPSFGSRLSIEEINTLAEWILTPSK